MAFLDWMLAVVDRAAAPERLMPLYTVTGHEVGAEAEITELAGYAGSRPVRVGNAARGQVQLDVFGPIAELVWQLLLAEAPVSSEHWRLVEAMVGAVEPRWHEPDHGIWEIRKPRRHHVHSKVMCWLAVDRGIQISERFLDRKNRRGKNSVRLLPKTYSKRLGTRTQMHTPLHTVLMTLMPHLS